MSRLSLILLGFILYCAPLCAEPGSGVNYVRSRLPHLVEAVESVAGKESAKSFFLRWQSAEVDFVEDNLAEAFEKVRRAPERGTPRGAIFNKYYTSFLGVLGEAYGRAQLKRKYNISKNSNFRFYDEIAYEYHNVSQKTGTPPRPDGLVYLIKGDKLHILDVLESKMGTSRFSKPQVKRYLQEWKQQGINIHGTQFSPANIFIGGEERARKLQNVQVKKLIQHFSVVSTTGIEHASYYSIVTPLDHQSMREVIIRRFSLGLSKAAQERFFKRYQKGKLFRLYKRALNAWVAKHKRFPSMSKYKRRTAKEIRLAQWVSTIGGQKKVFATILSRQNKQHLEVRMTADPEVLLNEWIKKFKRFPKTQATGRGAKLESKLAWWVHNKGGREWAYQSVMTPENRSHFEIRMKIEPEVLLNDWVGVHLRLPRQTASGNSQAAKEERRLANWVMDQGGQKKVANSMLLAKNRKLIEIRMKVEPLVVLNEWIAKHRRFPKQAPEGRSQTEKIEWRLGAWISKNGGQWGVFKHKLTQSNRRLLRSKKLVPKSSDCDYSALASAA